MPQRIAVDWPAVARDVAASLPRIARDAPLVAPASRSRAVQRHETFEIKAGTIPLAYLNEIASGLFPDLATIPVPVLLPIDVERLVGQQVSGKAAAPRLQPGDHRRFLFDVGSSVQLAAGTTGYDALVAYEPAALGKLGIVATRRRTVHVAGTALSYGTAEAGDLVEDLQDRFPGLRRARHDEDLSYSFVKYGVPYLATISCSNHPLHAAAFNCDQAEALLRVTMGHLRLIGGGPVPSRVRAEAASTSAAGSTQPTAVSPSFTYYPPGKLLSGTGMDGKDGNPDRTVYGDILYPIQSAPSYAQSQVYMHWGDCGGSANRISLPKQKGDTHSRYRCRQNSKVLFQWEGHPENYAYPWRDNFCEARDRPTPECPAGKGHQGQDIRASTCTPDPAAPDRCKPDIHPVVAVIDGKALREGNKVRLFADDSRLYYVYLHMNTRTLDAAGLKDQQFNIVKKGQVLGKVGNFEGQPGGTTTHLHFEIHPGSSAVRFNPYMTLIRAYERLIGAQGTEVPP